MSPFPQRHFFDPICISIEANCSSPRSSRLFLAVGLTRKARMASLSMPVPIAVQMCDMSQSLACMRPCFDIVPEPDWTDRDESCFWLVRMVYREPVAGVSQNACMDQCDDTILADARRDLARCQEGYHGL